MYENAWENLLSFIYLDISNTIQERTLTLNDKAEKQERPNFTIMSDIIKKLITSARIWLTLTPESTDYRTDLDLRHLCWSIILSSLLGSPGS